MQRILTAVIFCVSLITSVHASDKVTVFAAASLTNALEEIAQDYQQTKQVQIVTSFASSSVLARQIEQGAPADIFISADQKWMNYLDEKQQIDRSTRVTLLGNELVLIAPKSSTLPALTLTKSTDWQALLAGGRLAVGDPDHVPVGLYAKDALTFLGVFQQLEPILARADSVRAALMLVEKQEAPLGIVYGSDAAISNQVKIIALFPAESHKPVEYPIAIINNHVSARVNDFYAYLKTDKAAQVFKKYGFSTQ